MIPADDRQRLLHDFLERKKLSSARLLMADELAWGKSHGIVAAVEGNINLGGCDYSLRIGLCPRFPLVLPQIFLKLADAFGRIPHIERDGRICYRSSEGLLLDYHAPLEILEEALVMAGDTIEAGISGVNAADFLDELEAYWRQISQDGGSARCYVDPDDTLRRVQVSRGKSHTVGLVADSFEEVKDFTGSPSAKPPPLQTAHYVPLTSGVLEERFSPLDFMSLDWTRAFVLRHLTKQNYEELKRRGKKNYHRVFIVLGFPRAKGGKALVGLDYEGVSGGSPLLNGWTQRLVRYVALERRDRAVIMARAEGAVDIAKKHVGLVGCGAVGGHLAVQLARAGVDHLTLIDPDKLTAQNAFRHVLGKGEIGSPKVYAMKRELTSQVPYIDVTAQPRRIEDLLGDWKSLAGLDLLIYAAGDPTLGLYLNEQLHQLKEAPALLFTWLEPYGLGGHALLTNTRSDNARGCFGCLFNSPIDGEPRCNRADFAGHGQHFAKELSGCASAYTPYADLDAVHTAELAVRLSLDFLRGRSEGHPLISWKGAGEAFRAAGHRTSGRYELEEKALHELRFSYAQHSCPICRPAP